MDKVRKCLSQAPIFSKLADDDLDETIQLAKKVAYQKGDVICWQGEAWPMAAYLVSGKAEWAMLSPDGKRQVVFKLHSCDVIWAHSILDNQPMPASLEVKDASLVYLWPRDVIIPIIERSPGAMWDVSLVLLSYMRHVREVVYGFAFHPVAGRLARLLLEHYRPVKGNLPQEI